MDSFKVNTLELRENAKKFTEIKNNICNGKERLEHSKSLLYNETLCSDVVESININLSDLNNIINTLDNLSYIGQKISNIYEETEESVAQIVKNLSSVSPFVKTNINTLDGSPNLVNLFEDLPYILGKPVLYDSKRLLCEGWLWERIVKHSMDGE